MQWKVTVAPIGTVWFVGPSIILAAMQRINVRSLHFSSSMNRTRNDITLYSITPAVRCNACSSVGRYYQLLSRYAILSLLNA